jgi:hypothetical protein
MSTKLPLLVYVAVSQKEVERLADHFGWSVETNWPLVCWRTALSKTRDAVIASNGRMVINARNNKSTLQFLERTLRAWGHVIGHAPRIIARGIYESDETAVIEADDLAGILGVLEAELLEITQAVSSLILDPRERDEVHVFAVASILADWALLQIVRDYRIGSDRRKTLNVDVVGVAIDMGAKARLFADLTPVIGGLPPNERSKKQGRLFERLRRVLAAAGFGFSSVVVGLVTNVIFEYAVKPVIEYFTTEHQEAGARLAESRTVYPAIGVLLLNERCTAADVALVTARPIWYEQQQLNRLESLDVVRISRPGKLPVYRLLISSEESFSDVLAASHFPQRHETVRVSTLTNYLDQEVAQWQSKL